MPLERAPGVHRIEVQQLDCLLALVEERHYQRAAERLGATPAALADAIRTLEGELELQLLTHHNDTDTITATDAGLVFAEEARKVIADLELAVAEALRKGGRRTMVRIGAGTHLPSPRLQAIEGAPPVSPEKVLSRRELEVLAMMAAGASNAEIAERLVISESTVKSHVKNILRKLRASNRTQAASMYLRH
jgi:DNA-binding NarL/FixJ family response regulator